MLDERVLLLSMYDQPEQADIAEKLLNQLLTEAGVP